MKLNINPTGLTGAGQPIPVMDPERARAFGEWIIDKITEPQPARVAWPVAPAFLPALLAIEQKKWGIGRAARRMRRAGYANTAIRRAVRKAWLR